MNTTTPLHSVKTSRRSPVGALSAPAFTTPHFDTQPGDNSLKIIVWVPGVKTSGIEIANRETDLTITARKSHMVRPNWHSLHLEAVQRDYQLNLRLGRNLDYGDLRAELSDGVLTIEVPVLNRDRPMVASSRAA